MVSIRATISRLHLCLSVQNDGTMKNTTFLSIFAAIAFCLCGCSSDDDSDLSSVERSLVGCWQVVEHFNYSHQEPINGIQVIEFKSDRTQSFYQDGEYSMKHSSGQNPPRTRMVIIFVINLTKTILSQHIVVALKSQETY